MSTNDDDGARGQRLRELRTGLGLYQQGLADQLQAAGIALPDGKLDQPTISEMERGKTPVPDEVFAAFEGGLIAAAAPAAAGAGNGQRRAGGGNQRRRKPAAAAAPAPPPAEDDVEQPGPLEDALPPEDEPPTLPPRPADTPPAPAPTRAAPLVDVNRQVAALELELRKLFKGARFQQPMDDGQGGVIMLEGEIPGIAQIVGAAFPADGRVLELHGDNMAHAWAELARENAAVRRFLVGLTFGGAWRGVVIATLPVVYSIAVNHGLIPNVLGAPAPTPAMPAAPPQPEPAPFVPAPDYSGTTLTAEGALHTETASDAANLQAQLAAMQAELDRREAEGAASAAAQV